MKRPPAQCLLRLAIAGLLALVLGAAAAGTEDWGMYCADIAPGESSQHGAVVTQVLAGSAAAHAGIRPGDIVTAYAGRKTANVGELDAAIAAHANGALLSLSIVRAGRPMDLILRYVASPPAPAAVPHPQHRQALAALRAEDWTGAESYARAALDAEPRNAALWDILGAALQNQKETEGAIQAYRQALRLDPRMPSANVNLGGLMLSQGRREEARPHFERAAYGDPIGHIGDLARQRLAGLDMDRAMRGEGPAASARPDGLKALIEVTSFEVQAANATAVIGGGLREMLVTALHGSGYFIVIESSEQSRLELAGERALTRGHPSDLGATGGQAGAAGADIRVSGTVMHFDPNVAGGAFGSPIMGSPFGIIGTRISVSQVTIEIRVADARNGQLLARQQISGMARSVRGIIAGTLPGTGAAIPSSLDLYRNTPMELALRDCMQKAAYFAANNIPQEYFVRR